MTNILLVCACIVSISLAIDVVIASAYYIAKLLSKYKIVKKETQKPKQEAKKEPKHELVPTGTPICVRVKVPMKNGVMAENIEEIIYNELMNKLNGN